MKSTINPALVNLLRQNDPEVEFRLEAQEAALKEIPCRNPIVGRWITQIDVEHLLSALELDDISFAERFPSIAHLGQERRQRMKDEFAHHLDHCQHCSLKHSYELELDARIMRLWRQNKDSLLQLLDEGGGHRQPRGNLRPGQPQLRATWSRTYDQFLHGRLLLGAVANEARTIAGLDKLEPDRVRGAQRTDAITSSA